MTEYITSEQAFFKAQMGIKDAPPTSDEPEEFEDRQAREASAYSENPNFEDNEFPTSAPPVDYTQGADPGDDLPF